MIIPSGIAKRYATALFRAALKADKASEISEDAVSFGTLFSENNEFRSFLLSPQSLTKDKRDVIEIGGTVGLAVSIVGRPRRRMGSRNGCMIFQ